MSVTGGRALRSTGAKMCPNLPDKTGEIAPPAFALDASRRSVYSCGIAKTYIYIYARAPPPRGPRKLRKSLYMRRAP